MAIFPRAVLYHSEQFHSSCHERWLDQQTHTEIQKLLRGNLRLQNWKEIRSQLVLGRNVMRCVGRKTFLDKFRRIVSDRMKYEPAAEQALAIW